MSHTPLTDLQVGDIVFTGRQQRGLREAHRPTITTTLHQVLRLTASQAEIGHYGPLQPTDRTLKIRLADGKVIGENYSYARRATAEIIEAHTAEVEAFRRYAKAQKAVDDLVGRELHQLKLTTEQLEVLGEAWAKVKAMKTTFTTT